METRLVAMMLTDMSGYTEFRDFDFKGISERARVYRTCFGQTPVVRERVVLVQTNFASVQELADRHGWDAVHPVLDGCTGGMLEAARRHGGTNRGTLQIGSFFTFDTVVACLGAVRDWQNALAQSDRGGLESGEVRIRVGVHRGTLHVMKHTMMGRDIDVVRTLSALGSGEEILLSAAAADAARTEGLPPASFRPFGKADMRECGSKRRWLARYAETALFALPHGDLGALPGP